MKLKFQEEYWPPIDLSKDECEEIKNAELSTDGIPVDPETAELFKEKNIKVNSGPVVVSVEGKMLKISTDAKNFGDVLEP